MLFYRKVFVKREPEEGRKLPKLIIRKKKVTDISSVTERGRADDNKTD